MEASTSAELEIRTLVARYADAVNRYDAELWSATWSVDGVWQLGDSSVAGRDSVVDFWRNAMGSFEFALQLVYQGTIDINGNQASGRWYLTETLRSKESEHDRFTIGVYLDDYVKENGAWAFAKRSYRALYSREDAPGLFSI